MAEIVFDAVSFANVNASSCDECNARKLKCNRLLPCHQCLRKGFSCTYQRKRKRSDICSSNATNKKSAREDHSSRGKFDSCSARWSQLCPSPPEEAANHWVGYSPSSVSSANIDSSISFLPGQEERAFSPSLQTTVEDYHLATHTSLGSKDMPCVDTSADELDQIENLIWWNEALTMEHQNVSELHTSTFDLVIASSAENPGHHLLPSAQGGYLPRQFQLPLLIKIIDLYLRQLHPSLPLFKASELIDNMANGHFRSDRRLCAMILAICAFTLLQPQQPNTSILTEDSPKVSEFIQEALNLHNRTDLGENLALLDILTSICLFASFDLLKKKKAAWFRLQEAITMSEILDLPNIEHDKTLDPKNWEKRARLYLCLTVIERAYPAGRVPRLSVPSVSSSLLQKFAHISMQHCSETDRREARDVSVIRLMVETFDCLDNTLVPCWYGSCGSFLNPPTCQRLSYTRTLELLQKVPRRHHKDWLVISESRSTKTDPNQSRPESYFENNISNEQGDVLLTCMWVLNRLWQLALAHGHLRDDDCHPELRPSFAITIARETLAIIKMFTMSSFEIHGVGLDYKIYDIASSFIRVAFAKEGRNNPRLIGQRRVSEQRLRNDIGISNNSPDISLRLDFDPNTFPISSVLKSEIANGFFGFFALFKSGNSAFFKAYVDLYQEFVD